jgi:hypothetical protein
MLSRMPWRLEEAPPVARGIAALPRLPGLRVGTR